MKHRSLMLMALFGLFALPIMAQQQTIEPSLALAEQSRKAPINNSLNKSATTPIWTADFSAGLTGWTTQGYDGNLQPLANAVWEFRGPNTTPNNTQGSRGLYSGINSNPPTNDPLNSPTAANGFMIFDSDYLDNGGQSGNQGNGPAPAPHVGTLTSPVVDLSQDSFVVVSFSNYARVFFADMYVTFSADSGMTWTDTVLVHSNNTLGTNNATINGEPVSINASSFIGGSSGARIRFVFDGRPGNANGNGYYFWMIDGVTIAPQPDYDLRLSSDIMPTHPEDIIYDGNGGSGRYGIMPLSETRPISFDAEILNFGFMDQPNVRLQVDVEDASTGMNILSLSSPNAVANLASGGQVTFGTLSVGSWTPNQVGLYRIIYSAISDSINYNTPYTPDSDTFYVEITDFEMSLDFGATDNSIGTPTIGDDNSAIASRMDIKNTRYATAVEIGIGSQTRPGATIEVTIVDSTGFDFTNGFPSQPLCYTQHTVTTADSAAGVIQVPVSNATGGAVVMSDANTSAYYVVVRLFSNAGANPITIRNDQTFIQQDRVALMYYTLQSPRWYTGFSNSFILNAPHIKLISSANCVQTVNLGSISTSCSSYVGPGGTTFTQGGTGLSDIKVATGSGCDTAFVFDLNLGAIGSGTASICAGSTFTLNNGTVVNTPGTYRDTIFGGAAAGCDSIFDVTLTVPQINTTITKNIAVLSVPSAANTTYQWLNCTAFGYTVISGATSNSYTVTANGEYAVIVNTGGCADTSACYLVDDVSTPEDLLESLQIYPIPSDLSLTVELHDLANSDMLQIVDLAGRVVYETTDLLPEMQINTSKFESGTYFLRVLDSEHQPIVKSFQVLH